MFFSICSLGERCSISILNSLPSFSATRSVKPFLLKLRKGNHWDLLYFEFGKNLYAFRAMDVERLQRDEILAIPVYMVKRKKNRKIS